MSLLTKRQSLLGVILLTAIASTAILVGLRITQIECQINHQPCPTAAISQLNQYQNQRLFFMPDLTANQIATVTPEFRIQSYHLRLPNTLSVELKSQVPAYNLVSLAGQTLTINTDGQVMGHDLVTTSPIMYVADPIWASLDQSAMVPVVLHQNLSLTIADLKLINLPLPSAFLADQQTLALYLPQQPVVILDPTQAKIDIARLKIVLDELPHQEKNQEIQEVDVRYKLPVLRKTVTIPRHSYQ